MYMCGSVVHITVSNVYVNYTVHTVYLCTFSWIVSIIIHMYFHYRLLYFFSIGKEFRLTVPSIFTLWPCLNFSHDKSEQITTIAIDVEISEWSTQADGSRLRDISYTLSLNYSFGPKYSSCTEHQVYRKNGQPGVKHIVQTDVSYTCSCMHSHPRVFLPINCTCTI